MRKFFPRLSCQKNLLGVILLGLIASSCSMVRSTGVNIFADILSEAAPEIEKERSWEHFRDSISAQLSLVESLSSLDRDDERFLLTIVQGHAGYAFSIWETLYLHDFLALNDNQSHRNRAMVHYSKSIHYGEVFLKENDLSLEVLIKSKDPKRLLMDNLDDDEISQKIVLFLAQSIAGMVNLNRDQSLYLTALPAAKSMFDWVCELNPGIYGGACPLFYGAYEAGRPKMLGGNPEKGKEIFLKAIEAYPENYLIRVGYLQFYVVPRGDEDEFNAQAKIIEEFIAMETKEKYWKPLSKKKEVSEKTSRLNLFNATAIKRFQIMKQNKEEIF